MKIISGGQTGVDQGALEAAIELKLKLGGYCPKGRKSEKGPIPLKYPMTEMSSPEYHIRTLENILKSHGTLILNPNKTLQGGTLLTFQLAKKHEKPHFLASFEKSNISPIQEWLRKNQIETLNIAGPRESNHPGIQEKTKHFIKDLLKENIQ